MEQLNTGSGDNVWRDKIGKQFNLGENSVFIDQNTADIYIQSPSGEIRIVDSKTQEGLAQLQKEFGEGLERILKEINALKKNKTIKHLYSHLELERETHDLRFLVNNNLLFFTDVELENHSQLISFLKEKRTALFIGSPATGKTTAMIDLIKELEKERYNTYYHSFKKRGRWGDVWGEILENAESDTVFILDDVHLDMEAANEAFAKLETNSGLRILFVSREVEQHNEAELTDLFRVLKDYTVKTEMPSLDAKIEGIAKVFQQYFLQQKEQLTKEAYRLGDMDLVIRKSHRNLILLREYLRVWEGLPNLPLSQLEEAQIYKEMYQHYFPKQKIKQSWEKCLLQYLTLYYFEMPFRANPRYLEQTEALAEDTNRIVAEKDRLYSLYHGEYAHLLLKAYRAHNPDAFRLFPTWESFFAAQLKAYFLDFQKEEGYLPGGLALLNGISYSKKIAIDGVENVREIFKSLFSDNDFRRFLEVLCEEEKDVESVCSLLKTLLFNAAEYFCPFFEITWKNGVFLQSEYSFGVYCSAIYYLELARISVDFKVFEQRINVSDLAERASFKTISSSLSFLKTINIEKARVIFGRLDVKSLALKAEKADFGNIGSALNELKNINAEKTREIFGRLDTKGLVLKAENADFVNIGCALNELKNVNVDKARTILESLDTKTLAQKAEKADFRNIGVSLSSLKSIDFEKAREILESLDTKTLAQKAGSSNFSSIGSSLNELKSINMGKARAISERLDTKTLAQKAENSEFGNICEALNQLKATNVEKARAILESLDTKVLAQKAEKADFKSFGLSLNALKSINAEKAREIFDSLDAIILAQKAGSATFSGICSALNKLKNVNAEKAREIFDSLDAITLAKKAENADLSNIGESLNELKNFNLEKARVVFAHLSFEMLLLKIEQSTLSRITNAINAMQRVDAERVHDLMNILINTPDLSKKVNRQIKQWERMDKNDFQVWNRLVLVLSYANNERNELLNLVVDFGFNKKEEITEIIYQIATVGTFIRLLSKFRADVIPFVKNNIHQFQMAILQTREKKQIAGFIAIVHKLLPSEAITELFEPYQKLFPGDLVTISYTHYYLGKNCKGKGNTLLAKNHLERAKFYVQLLEGHEMTLVSIEELLEVLKGDASITN